MQPGLPVATYIPLGIVAPVAMWRAFGFSIHEDGTAVDHQVGYGARAEALAVAFANDGDDGIKVLGSAIAEVRRRNEEYARTAAQAAESKAIQALACAIEGDTDAGVLRRILPRLTERTALALRRELDS